MSSRWRAELVFALIGVLTHVAALAQSTFGTILRTVLDESAAVMPGCVVTVENVGTSSRRSMLTDETGSYTAQNLEPGTYRIKIEFPGLRLQNTRAFNCRPDRPFGSTAG